MEHLNKWFTSPESERTERKNADMLGLCFSTESESALLALVSREESPLAFFRELVLIWPSGGSFRTPGSLPVICYLSAVFSLGLCWWLSSSNIEWWRGRICDWMPGNTCKFDLTRSGLGTCAERVQTRSIPQG